MKTTASSSTARAREGGEPPPKYELALDGSFPTIVGMFEQLNPHLDAVWLRAALRDAETRCGPMTREQIGRGLDLAFDRAKRGLDATVKSPRGWVRKFVLDYLTEQVAAGPRKEHQP